MDSWTLNRPWKQHNSFAIIFWLLPRKTKHYHIHARQTIVDDCSDELCFKYTIIFFKPQRFREYGLDTPHQAAFSPPLFREAHFLFLAQTYCSGNGSSWSGHHPISQMLEKWWWCSSSLHCLCFIHNKKSKWFLIAVRHMPPFRGNHSFSQKNQLIKTSVFFFLQAKDPEERRTRRRTGARARRWPSPAGPARSSRSSGPTTADSPSPSATSTDTQTGPSTAWAQEQPESSKLSK